MGLRKLIQYPVVNITKITNKMFVILLIFTLTSFTSSSYINDLNADRLKHIQYFDLSYTFSNDTIYFPGQKQFQLHKDKVNVRGPGYS